MEKDETFQLWFDGPETATVGLSFPSPESLSCVTANTDWGDRKADCAAMDLSPGDATRGILLSTTDELVNYGYITWKARSPFNGDYELYVRLLGEGDYDLVSGQWQISLAGARGRWDAWSDRHSFLAGADNSMTVSSPASAHNVISVGAITTRNSWVNYLGNTISRTYQEGPVAPFSSLGPTRDGRSKPDIAAAGAWVISAASQSASVSDDDRVSDLHSAKPGTSMAAPHVAGAVALLMSRTGGASLDAAELKHLLQDGARRDVFTGQSPSPNAWGAGKLDVEGALRSWDQGLPTPGATTAVPTSTRTTPTPTVTRRIPTATPTPTPTATVGPRTPTATPTTAPPTSAPSPSTTPALPPGQCWSHGGELPQSVVQTLDNGGPAHAGRYSALLGDPSLGPALPGGTQVPVGSAWVEQRVRVPVTSAPRLTLWYRMVTYDVAQDALRQVWDIFGVYVDGELVFSDGNKSSSVPGTRHEIGWRSEVIDMSQWRGRDVTLRFANWNGHDGVAGAESYNTWTYLDDVYLLP